ncbi:MAG: tRNA pseudouridine(38-40) synthase TruA [Actinomycetota bacterium]|nr:tRNA pseudouridine(38-40) synthase TruA [Actinomycetota bacterium]
MIDVIEPSGIRVSGPSGQGTDSLRSGALIVGAIVSYIGTGFSGFAFQEGQFTVAGELLKAVEVCTGERPRLSVAGRTDAGVHARAQVISFPLNDAERFSSDRFVKSMNSLMDKRISMRAAWIADEGFHARFSARYRKYRYRFVIGSTRDPFIGPTSWLVGDVLDVAKMREGSRFLLGEHDFSSFCRKDPDGASLTRRVDEVVFEESAGMLDFWITASSFCHQMVRSIVGLLYQVGTSKVTPAYVGMALNAKDRSWVKMLAPASGLTLWEVGYDVGVLPQWS